MRVSPPILAFNRGLVSRLGLARVDLAQLRFSAEEQTNWMPRALGSMMLRPGLRYTGATKNDARSVSLPFVFEVDDLARLELTDGVMRVWIDDALLARPSVHCQISNGDFATDLSGWTDGDDAGASSSWTGGKLGLKGTGFAVAKRAQQVTTTPGEEALEHALRVDIALGPVTLKVGSAAGSDDMLAETVLAPGVHSLAFTPGAGSFFVELSHRGDHTALVEAIAIEAVGPIELASPYVESDLPKLRWTQSRDVIFLACDGRQPRRIERRAARSWSLVKYEPSDGPFRDENLSRVTLASSGLTGDVTLTASDAVFRSGHVGALFRLSSSGQNVSENVNGADEFTTAIRVTGVGADRAFVATRAGAGVATVTLQRSVGVEGAWEDVQTISAASTTVNDGLDNQIIFYRIGVKAGDYTSGALDLGLTFARGAIDGVARVTAVSSPTSADAIVLRPFGAMEPTEFWAEGEWSDFRGWPTATRLFQGRLWWGGRGRLWGSVSDAFGSFDADFEGDAGPIAKTITDGPADVVAWIEGGQRLVLGSIGGALEARSSSLDEPLTPLACQLKRFATAGVANVPAAAVNDRVLFVERAAKDLLEASVSSAAARHETLRLTALAPELGGAGFTRLAVQSQPDVRVHAVRADGTAAVLITDPAEDVRCWIEVETDGVIEDVVVLPSGEEDSVYYTVRRVIDGEVRRFHECWAAESNCRGGLLNHQADNYVVYSGAATSSIDGLDHLEGEEVVIWADGTVRDPAVVAGGSVAVSGAACENAIVGLAYQARFKSVKLAHGAAKGSALTQPKRVNRLSFILADVHADGLRYGPDFDNLDPLPHRPAFTPLEADKVHASYDFDGAQFRGGWSSDSRVCLLAEAPKPATVLGVVIDMETVER